MNGVQKIQYRRSASARVEAAVRPLLLCLSHLRWGFVYQRPQHIMSRMAQDYQVLSLEEPALSDSPRIWLESLPQACGVTVLVPHLPLQMQPDQVIAAQRTLLDGFMDAQQFGDLLLWYFTPMSLVFTDHLRAQVTIFDCMDELSAFKDAPPELVEQEKALMKRADVVFTGGFSLWEAKRLQHTNAHSMPSSVDIGHFAAARNMLAAPKDQQCIPYPRLGYFGVIDERFDIELIREVAESQPTWQIILIGPVVKIDPATLPHMDNVHYLGSKPYRDLPAYLSGWDVALMPFALNDSTRFISPTKTPEYLAGGCPVVSTRIADVVKTYGESGVVAIADDTDAFVRAIREALTHRDPADFLRKVDAVLAGESWDNTCAAMKAQIGLVTIGERTQCLG
ncbi:glycosyltransferase family 1 protein [Pseudomonas amygdali]|uniref:glycosyltransferase family 1 protein n=1 Tax=Pseudomonas amygdali TaxID=47877 RepID=UPI0006B8E1A8|nr:glycosyltransferase family 1 protein [Pseudomonas amygdali]PPS25691.1 glycosyl transferase [Pseudomonas amygdali pv. morsprunorum]